MIKLLIVDDHKIIRDGIKAMLSETDSVEIVGECENGKEVVPFLKSNKVDIIFMDINMPEQNGIETTKEVIENFPSAKIIALTMHNQESYITKMLKVGAVGYVLKNTGFDEILDAITTVNSGHSYFSGDVSEIMMSKYMKTSSANDYINPGMSSTEDLTSREQEIIILISNELTNNEIAEELHISPRTVDTHRRNLLQKLGVKNTAGLVKFAVKNNMLG